MFKPCGEPSVFLLVKSCVVDFDKDMLISESVLDQTKCYEGCFLDQGKNSSAIHHTCFSWSVALMSSPVGSLSSGMHQTVALDTSNVSAICQMGLF